MGGGGSAGFGESGKVGPSDIDGIATTGGGGDADCHWSSDMKAYSNTVKDSITLSREAFEDACRYVQFKSCFY